MFQQQCCLFIIDPFFSITGCICTCYQAIMVIILINSLSSVSSRQSYKVTTVIIIISYDLTLWCTYQCSLMPRIITIPGLATHGIHLFIYKVVIVIIILLRSSCSRVSYFIISVMVRDITLLYATFTSSMDNTSFSVILPCIRHIVAVTT